MRWLLLLGIALLLVASTLLWTVRDTTIYAKGFSDEAFRKVRVGSHLSEVVALLGPPLAEREENTPLSWCYQGEEAPRGNSEVCISFEPTLTVSRVTGEGRSGVVVGQHAKDVQRLLGEPTVKHGASVRTLFYSKPGQGGVFFARYITLDRDDRVARVVTYSFHD
jgi:outer membrane protein assembly factor BamE (lipoprotein component of BamABCDE complex)